MDEPKYGTEDYRRFAALFNDITFAPTRGHMLFSDRRILADYLWERGWRRDVRPEDVTEGRVEPPAPTVCDHPGLDHDVSWSYCWPCPKCGVCKFIGHGPLCIDCLSAPPAATTTDETGATHDCHADCDGSDPTLDEWNDLTRHWYCPHGNDNCAAHPDPETARQDARNGPRSAERGGMGLGDVGDGDRLSGSGSGDA